MMLLSMLMMQQPNFTKPSINQAPKPPMIPNQPSDFSGDIADLGSLSGPWAQPSLCLSEYPDNQPAVPFGSANANQNMSLLVEEGFKQVRGQLSEGRYLVLEISGFALTNVHGKIVDLSPATAAHEDIRQRWIIHAADDAPIPTSFYIQSALDKTYLAAQPLGSLVKDIKDAQAFTFEYKPNGATYTVQLSGEGNKWVSFLEGISSLAWKAAGAGNFKIFSVAYH